MLKCLFNFLESAVSGGRFLSFLSVFGLSICFTVFFFVLNSKFGLLLFDFETMFLRSY